MDLMARRRAIMGIPSGKDYTVSGNVVSISNALAKNAKSAIVTFLPKQSGSGDPSPNNIRPISGYNDIGAVRYGKNLLPMATYGGLGYNVAVGTVLTPTTASKQWQDNGDGTFSIASLGSWAQAGLISARIPLGKAYLKISNITGGLRVCVYVCNKDLKINRTSLLRNPAQAGETIYVDTTFTNDDAYFAIYLAGSGSDASITKPYVFIGDSASTDPYEPYISPVTANVHSDTTLFGGTVDLVSGECVVTWGMADMGTLGWNYSTSYNYPYFHTGVPSDNIVTAWNVASIGCSFYKPLVGMTGGSFRNNGRNLCIAPIYGQSANLRVALQDSSVTSVADLITKVSGQQLIYQFANPITYTLTPSQLALLKGNNTVYSNEGSISLTYVGK